MALMSFCIFGTVVYQVNAVVTMTPTNTTMLIDIPTTFTFKGLTASTAYDVVVDGAKYSDVTSDANGVVIAEVTISTAGSHVVGIADDGSTIYNVSTSVTVIDIIETIMPFVVLIITISIVFGIIYEIRKAF